MNDTAINEHGVSVRMAAGYGDDDFRDLLRMLNGMRSVAEAVVVDRGSEPTPREYQPGDLIAAAMEGVERVHRQRMEQLPVTRDGAAAELYRDALAKARDCCGCGEGSTEECAGDLLTDGPGTWREDIVQQARALLQKRYGL